jgi:Lrp/AsnC family transcriptional regulator, leucine-responsive regulatory protein
MIDEMNARILRILQEDGRISNVEIARQVGMAPSAVFERLRKLEESGVIQGYEARIDPHALGLEILAFVFVKTDERLGDGETAERLAAIPEVLELHHIAGEDCYLAKVRAANPNALGKLLKQKFGAIETVRSTRTTIALTTVKETGCLPIPER